MTETKILTDNEIADLLKAPDAMRCIADYNDFQESALDAIGFPCQFQKERRVWFNEEAKRIEQEWDAERKVEQRVFLPTPNVNIRAICEVIDEMRKSSSAGSNLETWSIKLSDAIEVYKHE